MNRVATITDVRSDRIQVVFWGILSPKLTWAAKRDRMSRLGPIHLPGLLMIHCIPRSFARRSIRSAFTMIEMLCVLLFLGVLVGLLLPAVQAAREMARRTSCANNLTQIAIATHNYHSAFKQLPTPLSGTDGSSVVGQDNDRRLSAFVGLLPFLEVTSLTDKIERPFDLPRIDPAVTQWYDDSDLGYVDDSTGDESADPWVAGGPEPTESRFIPWVTEPATLRCPSDPGIGSPAMGRTNYAVCLGDGVLASDSGPFKEINGVFEFDSELATETKAAMRGVFVPRVPMRLDDITDGMASTLMLGEVATGLGDRDTRTEPVAGPGASILRDSPDWAANHGLIDVDRPRFWDSNATSPVLAANTSLRRGYRWADGMPLYTAFNTILPPNREIVLHSDRDDCWGILPPSSRHQGGAHICFADASVRFVTDAIDAGDESLPTVYEGSPNSAGSESPYGLWGALGTRASSELESYSFADQAE